MEGHDYRDGLEALSWLSGTEAGKILQRKAPNGATTLVSYARIFPAKRLDIYAIFFRKKLIASFMMSPNPCSYNMVMFGREVNLEEDQR